MNDNNNDNSLTQALADIKRLQNKVNHLTHEIDQLQNMSDQVHSNDSEKHDNPIHQPTENLTNSISTNNSKEQIFKLLRKKMPDTDITWINGGFKLIKGGDEVKVYISQSKDYYGDSNNEEHNQYEWQSWYQITNDIINNFEFFTFIIWSHNNYHFVNIPRQIIKTLVKSQLNNHVKKVALYIDKIKDQPKILDIKNDSSINLYQYLNNFNIFFEKD